MQTMTNMTFMLYFIVFFLKKRAIIIFFFFNVLHFHSGCFIYRLIEHVHKIVCALAQTVIVIRLILFALHNENAVFAKHSAEDT